jgi:hypothetical protein
MWEIGASIRDLKSFGTNKRAIAILEAEEDRMKKRLRALCNSDDMAQPKYITETWSGSYASLLTTPLIHASYRGDKGEFFQLKVLHKGKYIPTSIKAEDIPLEQVYNLLTLMQTVELGDSTDLAEEDTIELVRWNSSLRAAVTLCHARTNDNCTHWNPEDHTPGDVYKAVVHDGANCYVDSSGSFVINIDPTETPSEVRHEHVHTAAWRTLAYLTARGE